MVNNKKEYKKTLQLGLYYLNLKGQNFTDKLEITLEYQGHLKLQLANRENSNHKKEYAPHLNLFKISFVITDKLKVYIKAIFNFSFFSEIKEKNTYIFNRYISKIS